MDASIVIPTRNRSGLLQTTIRSALRQRDVAFEVIVVDEGSTDDTTAVLAGIRDVRLQVIRHDTPRGLSVARNHGAEKARGEWLAFLDDDDLWAPEKLIQQLRAAHETGREWAWTAARSISRTPGIIDRPAAVSGGGSRNTSALSGDTGRRFERHSPPGRMAPGRRVRHSLPPRWRRLGAVHSFSSEARPPRMRIQSTDGKTGSFVQYVPRYRRDTEGDTAD